MGGAATHPRPVSSGGESFPGLHEPLVSLDLWEACRRISEGRTTDSTTRHSDTEALLNGLIYCRGCQLKLWHRMSGPENDQPYYRCSGYEKRVHREAKMVPGLPLEEQAAALVAGISLPSTLMEDAILLARAMLASRQAATPRAIPDPESVRAKLARLGLVFAGREHRRGRVRR